MPEALKLPYLKIENTKGHQYAYYRRNGGRQRIHGEIGSPEFFTNYARIHEQFESRPQSHTPLPGSFRALASKYFRSPEYGELKPRTRDEYRYYIELFTTKHGDKPVHSLTRSGVREIRDGFKETPAKANHMVKVLRVWLNFALDLELIAQNPAAGVKPLKTGSGWEAWPNDALKTAHRNLTGSPRLAFMLALYTGQRKSDILAMRWSDIDKDGAISVKQSKTGKYLKIPLHPVLREELSKVKRKGVAIVSRNDGRPLTVSGFNRMWRRQQEKHGLKGRQFHGLRRNAVNALLEAQCSVPQVASVTGQSYEMVEHYAQQVNQHLLAKTAIGKMKGYGWQT